MNRTHYGPTLLESRQVARVFITLVYQIDDRGKRLLYDVAERLPHVAGDEHDRLGTLFAQHVEKGVEGPDRAVTRLVH